jgi:hypothetical protein
VGLLALGDAVEVVVAQLHLVEDVPARGRVVAGQVREAGVPFPRVC